MPEAGRSWFDPAALARDAQEHGLVVLAGAGLSMGPRSSLPGWTDVNDAFLDSLGVCGPDAAGVGVCVADAAEFEVPAVGQVLGLIRQQRAIADVAQPDLQAQLAEERLGEHYFAVFRPLDIETWNDGHAAVAALAATGLVRAVVT